MPRKSASKKQRGGSLASNRVMKNLDSVAATHDYVISPRIRTKSNLGNTNTYDLTGGACGACGGHKHAEGFRGCGATAPTQSGGGGHKKEEFGSCGGSTTPTQSGGARRRRSNKSRKSSGKNRKSLRKSSGKNKKSLRKSSGKNRKTSGKTRKQRGGKDKRTSTNQKDNVIIIPRTFGLNNQERDENAGIYNNNNNNSTEQLLKYLKGLIKDLKDRLESLRNRRRGNQVTSMSNNYPPNDPDQDGEAILQENAIRQEIQEIQTKIDNLEKKKRKGNLPRETNPPRKTNLPSNNNKGTQRGGGSAWMNSQYSQTLSAASHARSSQFSSSAPASRNTLLNPPNMGLAGSGFGSTFDTNAPANLK